jgi:hypothetical protein
LNTLLYYSSLLLLHLLFQKISFLKNTLTVTEAEQDVALCMQEIEFITSKVAYLTNNIDNAVILSVRQGRYRKGSVLPKAQARLKFGLLLLKLAREKLADAQIALEDARIRCSTHTVGCK